jgi:hypothetical protein
VHTIEGGANRGPIVSASIAAGAILMLGLTVAGGLPTAEVALVLTLIVVVGVCYRTLLRWTSLLGVTIAVILFVPIKKYGFAGSLPFDLEPYRIVVMLVLAGWVASLLVDPRVRLRTTGIGGPLALIAIASLASVLVNGRRVDALAVGAEVVKALLFLGSFLLVVHLIVSVIRTLEQVRTLVKVLVTGGAIVAAFGVVEAQTGFNVFDHLGVAIPFLKLREVIGESLVRSGRLRVFASSQGPIPLGAALVMLLPLAIYLGRTSARPARWWIAAALLMLGSLAPGARTSVVMIATIGIVFLWLRPQHTRRALIALALPGLVAVHLALPGTIGALRASFFPAGGLIAEQSQNPGWRGSGRLADLGPSIDEFVAHPLLGAGYGSRITGRGANSNAPILDNQWLKTLVETGAIGAFAYLWLFVRLTRRLAPAAKADDGERGWLLGAVAASLIAFGVGQLFYDAFAFIQVTFLFYILAALACVALTAPATAAVTSRADRVRSASRAPRAPAPAGRPATAVHGNAR